jgi:hypothetical protein
MWPHLFPAGFVQSTWLSMHCDYEQVTSHGIRICNDVLGLFQSVLSSRMSVQVLHEPLGADRRCPHESCDAFLPSCSIADYPEDRDTLSLVTHNSFTFDNSPNMPLGNQAGSPVIPFGRDPDDAAVPDVPSHAAGSKQTDSKSAVSTARQLAPATEAAGQEGHCQQQERCRPITAERAVSSGMSERQKCGSPLQARASGAMPATFANAPRSIASRRAPSSSNLVQISSVSSPLSQHNHTWGATASHSGTPRHSRNLRRAVSSESSHTRAFSERSHGSSILLAQV